MNVSALVPATSCGTWRLVRNYLQRHGIYLTCNPVMSNEKCFFGHCRRVLVNTFQRLCCCLPRRGNPRRSQAHTRAAKQHDSRLVVWFHSRRNKGPKTGALGLECRLDRTSTDRVGCGFLRPHSTWAVHCWLHYRFAMQVRPVFSSSSEPKAGHKPVLKVRSQLSRLLTRHATHISWVWRPNGCLRRRRRHCRHRLSGIKYMAK